MLHLLTVIALASPVAPELMVGLGPGIGGSVNQGSGGGSVGIGAVWFPTERVGIDLGVREGVWANDLRSIGEIDVGARWRASERLDVYGGFVHHHEVPDEAFGADPIGAILGVSEGIRHRSGAGLGVSWGTTLSEGDKVKTTLRVDGKLSALVGDGPLAYGQTTLGIWFEIPHLR